VAAAEGVSAGESDDFLVVESHAVENAAQMVVTLGSVWKTAIRGAVCNVTVLAARAPWDDRSLHLLNGANRGKSPKIRVGDPWELLLDRVKEVSGSLETSIGTVVTLGRESHGCTIATTSSGLLQISSAYAL